MPKANSTEHLSLTVSLSSKGYVCYKKAVYMSKKTHLRETSQLSETLSSQLTCMPIYK